MSEAASTRVATHVKQRLVISLVERGWQAARECSLDLEPSGLVVVHLVKGRLTRSVRAMVAPKAHIHLMDLPRNLFWLVAWPACIGMQVLGMLRIILVDNDRAYQRLERWASRVQVQLVLVRPVREGYELQLGMVAMPRSRWREVLA